jgi:AcrR family transcriptional regulator
VCRTAARRPRRGGGAAWAAAVGGPGGGRGRLAASAPYRAGGLAAAAFEAHGWAGTTIASVARAAGVSPQVVHLSVGAKPALLVAAVEHAIAGDQPGVPLAEREPFRTAFAPDATLHDRATALAAGSRGAYQQAGAVEDLLGG